ncbi:hypothetical protein HYDPIDRAFT_116106 [Hydnomerulius pinastri MD-312]|uniref:Uncharacterized protein n=1 Tax=Hydnomerulius pinastri MD-312 TaxID=994086 RepID=A0A0C9WBN1_9AGAM|nr:hypothetical protein HYDPIDRAFT_116106 [Hydnomerulius pinastri MD-312]
MEEESRKETETADFERKRKEAEDLAEAKTAKNRAKRQKKKERAKAKPSEKGGAGEGGGQGGTSEAPLKKRRLVNGKELVFRRPGEESDEEEEGAARAQAGAEEPESADEAGPQPETEETPRIVSEQRIIIHEDD